MRKTKSSKTASAIALGITLTLVLVLLGGLMASVITKTSPADWFNKELVATTEEEMNELLAEENIGKSVKYTGETVKNVEISPLVNFISIAKTHCFFCPNMQ